MIPGGKHFEDFAVGERFRGPARLLTDEQFTIFQTLTGDDHPLHYDGTYAASHPFGRRVAHGLLLAAMTAVGGTDLSPEIAETVVAFVEQRTRFLAPGFIGDAVTPNVEVIECVPKTRGRGLVRLRVTLERSDGTILLEGEHLYLIKARGDMLRRATDEVLPAG